MTLCKGRGTKYAENVIDSLPPTLCPAKGAIPFIALALFLEPEPPNQGVDVLGSPCSYTLGKLNGLRETARLATQPPSGLAHREYGQDLREPDESGGRESVRSRQNESSFINSRPGNYCQASADERGFSVKQVDNKYVTPLTCYGQRLNKPTHYGHGPVRPHKYLRRLLAQEAYRKAESIFSGPLPANQNASALAIARSPFSFASRTQTVHKR